MSDIAYSFAGVVLAAILCHFRPMGNPMFRIVNMALAWMLLAVTVAIDKISELNGVWKAGGAMLVMIAILTGWAKWRPPSQPSQWPRVAIAGCASAGALWVVGRMGF